MKTSLTLLALAAAQAVQALPRITRSGRFLVDPTGARFFIKGVAYQPAGTGAHVISKGEGSSVDKRVTSRRRLRGQYRQRWLPRGQLSLYLTVKLAHAYGLALGLR
jgi:hypothetical protein